MLSYCVSTQDDQRNSNSTYALVFTIQRNGPVHQVEVQVVCAQLVEGLLQTLFGCSVEGAPELGNDEDLGSRHARGLDTFSHFIFVAVCPGAVDVSVTGLQRSFDGFRHFTGGS